MANFNLNKVILGGRLTGDPELKQTQSGVSVCTFGIAVNRRFNSKDSAQQTQADFFNITAWRQSAEFVSKYFRKGSSICVVGTIQNRRRVAEAYMPHAYCSRNTISAKTYAHTDATEKITRSSCRRIWRNIGNNLTRRSA